MGRDLWDEGNKGSWQADRGGKGDGVGRWKETSEGGEESRKGRKKEKKFSRTGGNQKQQNAQIVNIYQYNVWGSANFLVFLCYS